MTAEDIIKLLARRHDRDVFVPECKDGATHSRSHFRLDAWVMPRSWSNPAVTGYEVKVSRSDFVADDKWVAYLPTCNLFYFVCPYGLISVEECPEEAGLIWTSKNGTRLYTKKKAPHRRVTVPEEVFRYVLMSRSHITREYRPYHEGDALEYWTGWLERQRAEKSLGSEIRQHISRSVQLEMDALKRENERLQDENEGLAEIRGWCEANGVDTSARHGRWNRDRQLKALTEAMPEGTADVVRRARKALETFEGLLDEGRPA